MAIATVAAQINATRNGRTIQRLVPIKSAQSWLHAFPGQEKAFPQDVFVKPKNAAAIFDGTFVGCIDYEFEFAEGHHQTPIIFYVAKRKSGFSPSQAFAIMPLEVVPASNLLIQEWIEAGANAD